MLPDSSGDRPGKELGDLAPLRPVLWRKQAQGLSVGARTRGPADAMDVILRHHRQVIIDDVRDMGNIDAARGDVGGHQDPEMSVAKAVDGVIALLLRSVAVDRPAE